MKARSARPLLLGLLADSPDLTSLSDPAVWRVIRENAGRHGLAPLIASVAGPHLAAADRLWCNRILARSFMAHQQSLRNLDLLSGLFTTAGIESLSLKGPILALRYYSPPFLRKTSGDLDFGIRPADLELACECLTGAGYRLEMPVREARARSHHVELSHPSLPRVELHFRLSHGAFGTPINDFFDRSVAFQLPCGRTVRVLSPSDEILHLVLHRAYGRFATLFHLHELRIIRCRSSMDVMKAALEQAEKYHFGGTFALTEVAFRSTWGEAFMPAGIVAPPTWLHWRINQTLYEAFEAASEPGCDLTFAKRLRRRWIDLQVTDRALDASRFLAVMARVARYTFADALRFNLAPHSKQL